MMTILYDIKVSETEDMIPKIIHYCWFGKNKKSSKILKYINTWKLLLPDYKIIEWNENNFPINMYKYALQAYEQNKYAFVSDVARLYALYNFGGIYFDTDIEVLKPLDDLLNYDLVTSWESNTLLMTGFMAATKGNIVIGEFLNMYENILYINDDGNIDQTANTIRFTSLLEGKGLQINRKPQCLDGGICIKSTEEIGAFDTDAMSFSVGAKTILVHHCNASWFAPQDKLKHNIKMQVSRLFGKDGYNKIKTIFRQK